MDFSMGTLCASLVVSSIGFGIFLYGKKQVRAPQLTVGIVMMAYPYFVAGAATMWSIAAALVLLLVLSLRSGM